MKFDLYTTPPKLLLREDDKTSLFHAKLVPAAKVYLRVKDDKSAPAKNQEPSLLSAAECSILSDSILSQIDKCTTSFISEQQRYQEHDTERREEAEKQRRAELQKNQVQQQQQKQNDSRDKSSSKPKWFKM